MTDHDGHTVNVGPVTVGIDTLRRMAAHWGSDDGVTLALCDDVARLRAENAALAAALADLIDAASDHHHTECLLHDTRWGGVDTCDNLGVTPADSRRCPNCRLRDALAALEADR